MPMVRAVQQITGGDTWERGENLADPLGVSRSKGSARIVECASVPPFGGFGVRVLPEGLAVPFPNRYL